MNAGLIQSWYKLKIFFTPGHNVHVDTTGYGGGGIFTSTGSISGIEFSSVYNFTLNTVPDGSPPSGAIVTTGGITVNIEGWGFNYTFSDTFEEEGMNTFVDVYDIPYILEFTNVGIYLRDDNTSVIKWDTGILSYNGTTLQTVSNGSNPGLLTPAQLCFNGIFDTSSEVEVTNQGVPTGIFAGDLRDYKLQNEFRYGWAFKVNSLSDWQSYPIEIYAPLFDYDAVDLTPFLVDENLSTDDQICVAGWDYYYLCYVNGTESLSCVAPESNPYTIWGITSTTNRLLEMAITSYPVREIWQVFNAEINQFTLVKQGDFLNYAGTNQYYTNNDDQSYFDSESENYDPFHYRRCIPVNNAIPGYIGTKTNWTFEATVNKKAYTFIKFIGFTESYSTTRALAVPPGTIIVGTSYGSPSCFVPSDTVAFVTFFDVSFPSAENHCAPDNTGLSALPYITISGGIGDSELPSITTGGVLDNVSQNYYNSWGNPLWNIVMIDYPYNHSSSTFFSNRVNYTYHPDLTVGVNSKKLANTKFDLLNANGLSTKWLENNANYCSPWGVREYKLRVAQALEYPTTFAIGSSSSSRFIYKKSGGATTTGSMSGVTITNDDGNTILFELASFTVEPCMVTSISQSVTIVATDSNIIDFEVFIVDYEGNSMSIGEDSGTHSIDREVSSKWASSAHLDSLGTYDVDAGVTATNGSSNVFSQSKRAAIYGLTSTHTGEYLKIVANLTDEALGFTIDSITFNQPNLQLAEIVYENSNLCNILFRNGALLRFGTLEYSNTNTPGIKTSYTTAPTIGDLLCFENNFFYGKVATYDLTAKANALFNSTEYSALSDLFEKNSIAGFLKLVIGGVITPFYINSFSATYPYAQLHNQLMTTSTCQARKFVIIPGNTTPSLKNASSTEVLVNLSNSFGWNISFYDEAVECNEGYVYTFAFDSTNYFEVKPFKGFSFTDFLKQTVTLSVVNLEASNLNIMLNDGNTLTIRKNSSPVFKNITTGFDLQSVNSSAKNILGVTGINPSDELILKFSNDYSLGNTMTIATNVAQSDSKFIRTDLLVCGYYEIGASTLKLKLYSVTSSSATLITSHTTNITDIKDGSSIRLQDLIINGELYLSVAYVNEDDEFTYVKTPMHDFTGFA